ncbi:DUF2505 domain-containing protein [Blastococcus sp. SYSU D00695]
MTIELSARHPAPPDRVQATLTDESFLRAVAAALGARVQEATVDGATTRVRMVVPTAGIPAVFARFVAPEVEVTDTRAWRRDGAGWRCDVDVRTSVFGRTVEVVAERRLSADGDGTRSLLAGRARVDAPLVGRQAEKAVGELVGVVLRREAELLDTRLAGG